jgi:cytochrome P450
MSAGTVLSRSVETLWFLLDPVGFFERSARRHGPAFRARTWMYGDTLLVSDPDAVRDVLGRDPEIFRGGEANSFLRPVVGARSVSCIDGAEHAARRRMILPALHDGRSEGAMDAVRAIAEREIARLPEGRAIALQPAMRRIMLEAMLGSVLGNAEAADRAALGAAMTRLVDRGTWPLSQLGAVPWLQRDLGPLSPWALFQRDLARVDERLHAEIARRRAGGSARAARRDDVLDRLVEARDEAGRALDDAELRDDLITIAGAGYDTTATALAWTFERVLEHPEVHARILREIDARGADTPYLDATIKEALRQRPVLPTVSRVVRDDTEVAGHRVRGGTRVALCIYLAHHRAESYPDPRRFLPDRFLDARPSPHAWLPFGGGARRCPGMPFALDAMRAVIAATLSRVALRRARPGPSRPIFRGSTLAPADGARVVIARRSPATG